MDELLRKKRAGGSKSDAALQIGISRNMYNQWEAGYAIPRDGWVEPLMEYLNMEEQDVVMLLYHSRKVRRERASLND